MGIEDEEDPDWSDAEASEHLDSVGSEPALPLPCPAPCPSRARLAPAGVHSVGPVADFKTVSPRPKESKFVFIYERGSRQRERTISAQRWWPRKSPGSPLLLPPPASSSLDEWKTLGPPELPTCSSWCRASSRQWPSVDLSIPKERQSCPLWEVPRRTLR